MKCTNNENDNNKDSDNKKAVGVRRQRLEVSQHYFQLNY